MFPSVKLLAAMKEVLNAEVSKEFFKNNKVGLKVFFVQRKANKSGLFLSSTNMAKEGNTAPSPFQRVMKRKGWLGLAWLWVFSASGWRWPRRHSCEETPSWVCFDQERGSFSSIQGARAKVRGGAVVI